MLSSSPRFVCLTSVPQDIDLMATYGSLSRRIDCLKGDGGNLVVRQSSPFDDTGSNDVHTIPVSTPYGFDISVSVIKSTTTALPILVSF